MKNPSFLIRLAGITLVGVFLLKETHDSRYTSSAFDIFFTGPATLVGIGLFIWSAFADLSKFRESDKGLYLLPVILSIGFAVSITAWERQIIAEFEKPSLMRVSYDGKLNGSSIDFKKDGSYIFEKYTIKHSDYLHGTFTIQNDLITLDKPQLDNVIKSNRLMLSIGTAVPINSEPVFILNQVDAEGRVIPNTKKFKVVEDFRND